MRIKKFNNFLNEELSPETYTRAADKADMYKQRERANRIRKDANALMKRDNNLNTEVFICKTNFSTIRDRFNKNEKPLRVKDVKMKNGGLFRKKEYLYVAFETIEGDDNSNNYYMRLDLNKSNVWAIFDEVTASTITMVRGTNANIEVGMLNRKEAIKFIKFLRKNYTEIYSKLTDLGEFGINSVIME